ncbi:ammonium transporter Rh type A-like isoform X2 [Clytia hemisphaerica]|uniref:Ammonium transporter AmtB-like domain-containing protein n=1 Tax=Clytia hemisphaerica TaxID=252671 RepID=A0A7M6DJ16_9CNID
MVALPKVSFSVFLFSFQIVLLALFANYVEYDNVGQAVNDSYPQFQDVHVMMFFGIGFLMTFLKRYGFGSITYNFLIGAVVIQWATLVNAWCHQSIKKADDPTTVKINLVTLMTSDFTSAVVLISYGAVLGKISRFQILVMAILECVVFAVSESVIMKYLGISDIGGSIVIHLFAAYFGIAVSTVIGHPTVNAKESSDRTSDLFSMAGTIFLWVYWPSFNSGLLSGKDHEAQTRAIINTYFSLAACVVTTMVISPMLDKRFKVSMVHIQNATLAGGVAVGAVADLHIQPWGAILIGMIASVCSVLGYSYLTPFLSSKLKIHDTCGIHNLHGIPGFLSAIFSAIAAPAIGEKGRQYYTNTKDGSDEWSLKKQGGYQIAAAFVSFAFAVIGGIITGFIMKHLDGTESQNDFFDDNYEFLTPEEEEGVEKNHNSTALQNVFFNDPPKEEGIISS